MKRRILIALFLAAGACCAIVVGIGIVGPRMEAERTRREFRDNCMAILHGMDTPTEARDAMYFRNNDGLVVHYSDGSWIAIRYKDRHIHPGWSLAVARDSRGRFYESSKHFCGAFYFLKEDLSEASYADPRNAPGALAFIDADLASTALGENRIFGIRAILQAKTVGDADGSLAANEFSAIVNP